jgi:hypothetical protein
MKSRRLGVPMGNVLGFSSPSLARFPAHFFTLPGSRGANAAAFAPGTESYNRQRTGPYCTVTLPTILKTPQ